MNLFISTISASSIFFLFALTLLLNKNSLLQNFTTLLKQKKLASLSFLIPSSWFLFLVLHLREADFGNLKNYLFLLFSLISLGSILFLKEFLVVRSLSITTILLCQEFLNASYMSQNPWHSPLTFASYLLIIASTYLTVYPFKLRNLLQWLNQSPPRITNSIIIFFSFSITLLITSFLQ